MPSSEPYTTFDYISILLDIDHFKSINDTHGHLVGDQVIAAIGQLAPQQIRQTDHVFRWGGEEFLVLLNHCRLAEAQAIAEKLRLAVANHRVTTGKGSTIGVTVSLGVGEVREDELPEELLSRVDASLYVAKENGRNRVEVSDLLT